MNNTREQSDLFTQLYTEQYRPVFKLVCKNLSTYGFSTQEAADLTQEVFCRCAKHIKSLLTHPNPPGWLMATAVNVCKEYAKGCIRRREYLSDSIELHGETDDLIAELDARLTLEQVLTPEDYALLKAYCIDKQPTEQICRENGISANLLRVRIHRIKKNLTPFFVLLVIFASTRTI